MNLRSGRRYDLAFVINSSSGLSWEACRRCASRAVLLPGRELTLIVGRRRTEPTTETEIHQMSSNGSISRWIDGLKAGEAEAAQRLWERYVVQLVRLARRRLGSASRSVVDEDDVAQTVFSTICRGATDGRFSDVKNRDDLWWLLVAITRQSVASHMRRECAAKRGAGRVHPESQLAIEANGKSAFDFITGCDPTPDFLAMLDEQFQRLLGSLRDDQLREIAILRFEGYTVAEIADKLSIAFRSAERKLQLIRSQFVTFLNQSE